MKLLIVLGLMACAHAQFLYQPRSYLNYAPPRYYSVPEAVDTHAFGFKTANQARDEVRDTAGNVAGAYSYQSPDGKLIQRRYTAGPEGFKQEEDNFRPETVRTDYTVHHPVYYSNPNPIYRANDPNVYYNHGLYGYTPRTYSTHHNTYRKIDDESSPPMEETIEGKIPDTVEVLNRQKRDTHYVATHMPYHYMDTMPMHTRANYYNTMRYNNMPANYYNTMRYNNMMRYNMMPYSPTPCFGDDCFRSTVALPYGDRDDDDDIDLEDLGFDDDKKKRKKRSASNAHYRVSSPEHSGSHRVIGGQYRNYAPSPYAHRNYYVPNPYAYRSSYLTAPRFEYDDDHFELFDDKKRKKRSAANFHYRVSTPNQESYHTQTRGNLYRTYADYNPYLVAQHPYLAGRNFQYAPYYVK